MMYRRILFAMLPAGMVLLMISCQKASETDPQPIKAIDSPVNQPASKNSLDSILGTYYGYTNTIVIRYYNGTSSVEYQYSGPDTVRLVTDYLPPGYFSIRSSRIRGNTTFKFDTSGHISGVLGSSDIYIRPNVDSIQYEHKFFAGDWYDGEDSRSTFSGRK